MMKTALPLTKQERKNRMLSILATVCALVIGFVIIFPVLYTYTTAFKSRAELAVYPPSILPKSFANTENFATALKRAPLFRFMLNSVIMASLGSFLRITFAMLAAYAFAYYDFKGKNFLFFVVLATMMLPGDTLMVTNYLTVSKLQLNDTYLGMCITSLVGASQMFMLRQNFKTLPTSLKDAAFMDGCGDVRYLLSVIIPLSKPIVLTLLVQSFISLWNAYLWPLMVTNKTNMRTVQVGVTMLTTPMDTNYSLVLAGVAIVLIPSFILFGILRKNIVRGITEGALVG